MSSSNYYRSEEEIVQAKILHRDPGIIEENYASKPPSRRSSNHTDHLVNQPSSPPPHYQPQDPNQKHAQPLPSPLHSPVKSSGSNSHRSGAERSNMAPVRSNSRGSSSSGEESGERIVAIGVMKDTGTKVELKLTASGLKKNTGFLHSFVKVFKKPTEPSRLLANGRFTEFVLTENSLRFHLELKTEKKKKKGNANRTEQFVCEVKKFPSDVNPDSAKFEVLEPASGRSYILLTLIKTGNLSINWKEFMSANNTIDVTEL